VSPGPVLAGDPGPGRRCLASVGMTTTAPTRPFPAHAVRSRLVHAVTLLPGALATASGSADAVERRRARLRPLRLDPGTGPVARRVAVLDAVLGLALGAVAWFVLGLVALSSVRGPFYGLVVAGPYDDAWGGPSLAGAWVTHAAVWALTLPVFAALLVGLGALAARASAHLLGGRRSPWAPPVAVLVVLAGAFVIRAWAHQV
jgi:hypothetical protein